MNYTREQLEAMPDRELDAVVAEVVMQWMFNEVVVYDEDDCRCPPMTAVKDGKRYRRLPEFSTDIAAAWEVVERIRPRSAQVDVWVRPDGKRACYVHAVDEEFWKKGDFVDDVFAEADTAPRAISIAAVLAVQEASK